MHLDESDKRLPSIVSLFLSTFFMPFSLHLPQFYVVCMSLHLFTYVYFPYILYDIHAPRSPTYPAKKTIYIFFPSVNIRKTPLKFPHIHNHVLERGRVTRSQRADCPRLSESGGKGKKKEKKKRKKKIQQIISVCVCVRACCVRA